MATNVSDILQGYLYDTVTTLDNMDFFNKVVQFDDDSNRVASSDATFLFAGPPVLNPKNGWGSGGAQNQILDVADGSITGAASTLSGISKYLRPIGAVQQYSLSQGRQVIPFTELGSRLKRHVVGSGMYNATMARVLTRSSNLKAALYSWLPDFLAGEGIAVDRKLTLAVAPSVVWDKTKRPWEHYNWVGMESEILSIPFGLLAITGTAGGDAIHMEYLERCYMPAFSNGFNAGSPMIASNVQIMVTRPVPFTNSNGEALIPKDILLKKTSSAGFELKQFTAVNIGDARV